MQDDTYQPPLGINLSNEHLFASETSERIDNAITPLSWLEEEYTSTIRSRFDSKFSTSNSRHGTITSADVLACGECRPAFKFHKTPTSADETKVLLKNQKRITNVPKLHADDFALSSFQFPNANAQTSSSHPGTLLV